MALVFLELTGCWLGNTITHCSLTKATVRRHFTLNRGRHMETPLTTLVKRLIWISGVQGYELELRLVQNCRFAVVLFVWNMEKMFISIQFGLKSQESISSYRPEDVSQPTVRVYNNTLHSTSSFSVGRILWEYTQSCLEDRIRTVFLTNLKKHCIKHSWSHQETLPMKIKCHPVNIPASSFKVCSG